MATKLSIINRALRLSDKSSYLTESNLINNCPPLAKYALEIYPTLKYELLTQKNWRFALHSQVLNLSDHQYNYSYPTKYDIPNDCIKIYKLIPFIGATYNGYNNEIQNQLLHTDFDQWVKNNAFLWSFPSVFPLSYSNSYTGWRRVGKYIYTQYNNPLAIYVRNVPEEEFPIDFANALSFCILRELKQFSEATQNLAEKYISTASASDKMDSSGSMEYYNSIFE